MSSPLASLPQNLAGTALVNAINDRLRRIASGNGAATPGAAGATGTPGTPGAGGATPGIRPIALVANLGSTFRPALALGNFHKVVLAANSTLLQPTGAVAGGASTWTLIVDNPTGAMLTLTPDPAWYFLGFVIAVDTATRTQIAWTMDENGKNSVSTSASGNPIP